MNYSIHRPVEFPARLHAATVQPTPTRPLFDFTVGRLTIPRYVPPEDRFVKRFRLPDCARVHTVVEEYYERAPPVPADGKLMVPPPRPFHSVRCEIERVDLRLSQVVPPCHVALLLVPRKSRQHLDDVLLPGPGHHGAKMRRTLFAVRPGFVPCCAAASSWTQSRKSRISWRPSSSSETPRPQRSHFLSVVEYSSRVRCACLSSARTWISRRASEIAIKTNQSIPRSTVRGLRWIERTLVN